MKQSMKKSKRKVFSNVSGSTRLSIEEIAAHVHRLTGGWPKRISGLLCVPDGDGVTPVTDAPDLFAYIDRYARVEWRRNGVPKAEFFAGLGHFCETYAWASTHPHFPSLPNVYYLREPPPAENTGLLDQLVDFFCPATQRDRELLKGLVLTLFWGGPGGRRPLFIITMTGPDPAKGRGAGKTALVEKVGRLVGGLIDLRVHLNRDKILTTLLSPSASMRRAVSIDNLKTYLFSDDTFEWLVTANEITGHRMYHGFAGRPNHLTYMVTVNGASFSKDLAMRSVVINLARPTPRSGWDREVDDFIDTNREAIVADVRWHLKKKRSIRLEQLDRFGVWDREVLSKLDCPNAIMRETQTRREAIDADDQGDRDMVEHIRACIEATCTNKNNAAKVVLVEAILVARWVAAYRVDMSPAKASQYVKQLNAPNLTYHRTGKGRFYKWVGDKATADDSPAEIVRYDAKEGHRAVCMPPGPRRRR